jgi:hypothetical protein
MKYRFIFSALFLILTLNSSSQQAPSWEKWSFLLGEWIGEGSGQPGQGGGTFTFYTDLNQNILVRKSHSEYAASGNRPATIHDDLMVVYPESSGVPTKAIYFDNEGHVIDYSIAYSNGSIVLTSEKKANIPVFRLTYTPIDSETVNTKFEMSQDGEKFMTYIEGKSKKAK